MARLMPIELPDRSDAILIATHHEGATHMGLVAVATVSEFLQEPLSTVECMRRVERLLPMFESTVLEKSSRDAYFDETIECVVITTDDLMDALAPLRRN